ncbi:MAG TPA: hypothetical protein VE973_01825 [Candidatus Limnocylindria bacterium]|nr:hypothetical protein [Candidatus Limnocylindria bacterium]
MKTVNLIKLAVAIVAAVYFLWCAADPGQWHFIDTVNLLIHEAGHIIFMPFGQFLYVLGGSLTQVLFPALFVIYFIRENDFYSSALTLFWVGENLLNVSVYAGDSIKMQLPLLGDSSMHDWNWLLTNTGLLPHTDGIALIIRLVGTLTIIFAAVWAIYWAIQENKVLK